MSRELEYSADEARMQAVGYFRNAMNTKEGGLVDRYARRAEKWFAAERIARLNGFVTIVSLGNGDFEIKALVS